MRAPHFGLFLLLAGICLTTVSGDEYISGKKWPEPPVVDPGPLGGPPADAIVLIGNDGLGAWQDGSKWKFENGVATAQGGGITSKQPFGDCQLHVEWAAPEEVASSGQGRGNSGVYLMGKYEVQILDSHNNPTYFDGQCGSVYKQHPPLVNVCRKPGEWQAYDIVFTAPRFSSDGKLEKPAYVTVLHNGVLIQNHFELEGITAWDAAPKYEPHPAKLPLHLQDHGNPVKFRNLWIREL